MKKKVPLTEDPAFRDLNMDDLGTDWDHYSGLPSPTAYEKRNKEKKRMEDQLEDGVDIFSVYRNKKTTFSDSLEDDE